MIERVLASRLGRNTDVKLYDFFDFFGMIVVCSVRGYLVSLRKTAPEGKKKHL
jgi:hypothetical protein